MRTQSTSSLDEARVHCLGVGEGWPCPVRRHAAFLHEWAGGCLLIDCGEGLDTAFRASGVSYDRVDAILLSHMHSDHVGSFSLFLQSMWLEKRQRPLTVIAPRKAIPALKAWLRATLVFPELLGYPIRWKSWSPGRTVQVGAARIRPYSTSHLASLKKEFEGRNPTTAFEAYSFLIEYGRWRVGHTADIGHVNDLKPLLQQPLDLMVSELSHVDPSSLFESLRGHSIRRLALIHLHRDLWANRLNVLRQVRRTLKPIDTQIPRDGDILTLS